ncbi:MAG TPA: 30S ribosomal protein S6 [Opitutales bacterium]|nr:30S ribosomal protein S6 [Opitutales bacterium]
MSQTSQNYKATFVLDMRDRKESVEEIIEELKKEVEAEQAEIVNIENLGPRDFARTPDRNLTSGIYLQIDFRMPSYRPNALHERFRLNKAVDRILVQRTA